MLAISKPHSKNRSLDQSFGLLIFLQIFMIILCLGGPLSILAPVPLVLALLIFGRAPAILFSILFLALGQYLIQKFQVPSGNVFIGIELTTIFCAVMLAEVVFRNIAPMKGLILSGLLFVTVLSSLMFAHQSLNKLSLRQQMENPVHEILKTIQENNKEVIEAGSEEGRVLKSLITNQGEILDELINYLPSIIFVSCFLFLWVSFYAVMRLSKIWRFKNYYSFGPRDLISFKTPEYFVYPLIVALVLYLAANYGMGKNAEIIGGNLLFCLGIFYFFQGFGIIYDFLTFVRIGGIFKSVIIILILMTGFKLVAVVGMFDLWFDFRKFFIRKNKDDEGDIL